MPHMTHERVRAGLAREKDLSLLHQIIMKVMLASHLGKCIQSKLSNRVCS